MAAADTDSTDATDAMAAVRFAVSVEMPALNAPFAAANDALAVLRDVENETSDTARLVNSAESALLNPDN
jgi:hypothetical protein